MVSKIARAQGLIQKILTEYKNPVVMSSFGKDSMVLLDILKRMEKKLPIVFHREPFEPTKYIFANEVILREGYVVYDYPPVCTRVAKNGVNTEIISYYQIGEIGTVWLGTGVKEPKDGCPFLCGYEDIYKKPVGYFKFPWDIGLVGHKSCDTDPIMGDIPLKVDINLNEGACDYAYPLRYFTDVDIWEYTERFGVPYNDRRYDKVNGYREFADITYNNDYYYVCTRCMDKGGPATVTCPKTQQQLVNIGGTVEYAAPPKLKYLDKE